MFAQTVILTLFFQFSYNSLIAYFPFGTSTTDETIRFKSIPISVSAWIRPQTTTALISARPFWVVHWNSNGNLQFSVSQDGVWRTVTSKITERIENTWVHFVGVFKKNGEISVYINTERAILNTGVSGPINGVPNPNWHEHVLKIGYDKMYGYYTGSINDVRLYNHALTPSEVKKLYCQIKFGSENCLKVMSWNVRNMHGSGFPMDDRYFDYERGLDVRKKLMEYKDDYDVIGLCEVWSGDWKYYYGSIFPYFYYVGLGEASMSDGLVIMSNYPFLEKNFYSYHDTVPSIYLNPSHRGYYNSDSLTNKGFLVVKLNAPHLNNPTIVMTHTNSEDHFNDIRHFQMSAIRSKINHVTGPIIIMGDLNFDLKLHEDGGTLNPTSENALDPEYIWSRQMFYDFTFAEEYVHNGLNKQFLPTYCPKTNPIAAPDEDCYKFDYMIMRNAVPVSYYVLNGFCYCDSKSIPCSDHDAISSVIGIKETSYSYTIDHAHDDLVFSEDYYIDEDEWFPKNGGTNFGYLDIAIQTWYKGNNENVFLLEVCGSNGGCQKYDGFDLLRYIPGGLERDSEKWFRLSLKYNIGVITEINFKFERTTYTSVWRPIRFFENVWQINPYEFVYRDSFEWVTNGNSFYDGNCIWMNRNSNIFTTIPCEKFVF